MPTPITGEDGRCRGDTIDDVASSFHRLAEKLGPVETHDFGYFMRVREEVLAHIAEGADDARYPMIPQRIVADVRTVMPDDGVIALDTESTRSGSPVTI